MFCEKMVLLKAMTGAIAALCRLPVQRRHYELDGSQSRYSFPFQHTLAECPAMFFVARTSWTMKCETSSLLISTRYGLTGCLVIFCFASNGQTMRCETFSPLIWTHYGLTRGIVIFFFCEKQSDSGMRNILSLDLDTLWPAWLSCHALCSKKQFGPGVALLDP